MQQRALICKSCHHLSACGHRHPPKHLSTSVSTSKAFPPLHLDARSINLHLQTQYLVPSTQHPRSSSSAAPHSTSYTTVLAHKVVAWVLRYATSYIYSSPSQHNQKSQNPDPHLLQRRIPAILYFSSLSTTPPHPLPTHHTSKSSIPVSAAQISGKQY